VRGVVSVNDMFRIRRFSKGYQDPFCGERVAYDTRWRLEHLSDTPGESISGSWQPASKLFEAESMLKFLEATHCPRAAIRRFIEAANIDDDKADEIREQCHGEHAEVFI